MNSAGGADPNKDRRDFLTIATYSMAALGGAVALWPFIDGMNPAADTVAAALPTEVDLSAIDEGGAITVVWRKQPVFVRRRTSREIAEAEKVDVAMLRDPQSDAQRVQKKEWLIVVGICTHLGCIPAGQRPSDVRGDYGGWYCSCHGSHYDTSGRIRKGPAPLNLLIPPYSFVDETTLLVG